MGKGKQEAMLVATLLAMARCRERGLETLGLKKLGLRKYELGKLEV